MSANEPKRPLAPRCHHCSQPLKVNYLRRKLLDGHELIVVFCANPECEKTLWFDLQKGEIPKIMKVN